MEEVCGPQERLALNSTIASYNLLTFQPTLVDTFLLAISDFRDQEYCLSGKARKFMHNCTKQKESCPQLHAILTITLQ